ncbi:hypothetical protein KG091_04395 [Carnobacteriaceae bacterium zg-ZUI78]|nr:hypothetical protein [Carnobacteriaceae bacterium zg-ZUI78]
MPIFLSDIDLKQNQLLNAVIENSWSEPQNPQAGQLYFDTTKKCLKYYNNEEWIAIDFNDLDEKLESAVDESLGKKTGEFDTKVTNKATETLNSAKAYVNTEIAKLVDGASGEYDTFKEIEAFLKANANALSQAGQTLRKEVFEIGDGVKSDYTITHTLNTQDVVVEVYTVNAPYEKVLVDVEHTSANTIKISTAAAIRSDEKLKVVVVG